MRRVSWLAAIVAVAIITAGCFNPFSPQVLTERVTTIAPSPTTPENAVKLFEWCWVNRGVEEYKELFTDDYIFESAATDSAGNQRNELTRRNDEVDVATNMFIGTVDRQPAQKITLAFDRNFVPFPDPRPNKNGRWHKEIRTSVALTVQVDESSTYDVVGHALFFLTRGDSAQIPAELKARGFKPDSLRWWIDRWEDETLDSGGNGVAAAGSARGAQPKAVIVLQRTMAQLKAIFRSR